MTTRHRARHEGGRRVGVEPVSAPWTSEPDLALVRECKQWLGARRVATDGARHVRDVGARGVERLAMSYLRTSRLTLQ